MKHHAQRVTIGYRKAYRPTRRTAQTPPNTKPVHIPPSIVTVSILTGAIAAVEALPISIAIADGMPHDPHPWMMDPCSSVPLDCRSSPPYPSFFTSPPRAAVCCSLAKPHVFVVLKASRNSYPRWHRVITPVTTIIKLIPDDSTTPKHPHTHGPPINVC